MALNKGAATLEQWIELTRRQLNKAKLFFGHGTQTALDEAAWLVASAARLAPGDLPASLGRPASKRETNRILSLTEMRITTRKPLAYLLGEAWLSGYRFIVDERVIVPRSFIAGPLSEGLSPWLKRPNAIKRVLDLCTGSGCLAIIAALAFPKARIDAADISRKALAVAKKNVKAYELENRITLIHSDLYQALPLHEYDLIISNPPYVKAASMRKLPAEYRSEPILALAGGMDGLRTVAHIVNDASKYLKPAGHLIIEIGHNRAAFERRFRQLSAFWLSTDSASDAVVWVDAVELADLDNRTG